MAEVCGRREGGEGGMRAVRAVRAVIVSTGLRVRAARAVVVPTGLLLQVQVQVRTLLWGLSPANQPACLSKRAKSRSISRSRPGGLAWGVVYAWR